jgi:two-component system LytT family sensor kinase
MYFIRFTRRTLLFHLLFWVVVYSIFVVIHQFFVQVSESKQLEIEKIKNELNFLKAQFQPHFLFNTLNNMYSLTFDNSQLAGKSILQ